MELFSQLATLVVLAAVVGVAMNKLRQPAILGYILAGVIASTFNLIQHQTGETVSVFGEIGVTLLLFLVGMELSWPKLKIVGKAAVSTGIGQIVFTTMGGILLALVLGFEWLTSVYIAIALTFSSTIIIVKLLSEKNDLHSLHGRIAVGMLLVQDFAAILILVLLSSLELGELSVWSIVQLLIKFGLLAFVVFISTRYLIPGLVKIAAHSTELLFLSSAAWGIGLAAFLAWEPIGFSIEVGGFVAGITLAGSIEQHQILSRLRPLRDFFIMLFFVYLGSKLTFSDLGNFWLPTLVFSIFVLLGNPLIVIFIMRSLNYRARTSFMTSLTVAQISEFSLIVIAAGQKLGHIPDNILGLVTVVGALTMTGSTYMILGAENIWKNHSRWLKKIEKPNSRDLEFKPDQLWQNHVVLIGCHRTGWTIWQRLKKKGQRVLIIDFNPDNVRQLARQGADVLYGDIEDIDNLELAHIDKAKVVISTVIDHEATLMLLEYLKDHPHRRSLSVIVTAGYPDEAKKLYQAGADYVVVPRWITGVHLGDLLVKLLKSDKSLVSRWANREKKTLLDHPIVNH